MKTIAENGVPSVEIARVLSDGVMPKELTDVLIPQVLDACSKDLAPPDVDAFVNLYDNLRLKSNIPLEVIEHVDNTLIQVSFLITISKMARSPCSSTAATRYLHD